MGLVGIHVVYGPVAQVTLLREREHRVTREQGPRPSLEELLCLLFGQKRRWSHSIQKGGPARKRPGGAGSQRSSGRERPRAVKAVGAPGEARTLDSDIWT